MNTGITNTKTGKIYGCSKYSKVWWHEKGHKAFGDSEQGIRIHQWQSFILKLFFCSLLGGIMWDAFIFPASVCMLIYLGIDLYEERWCWKYADKKLSKSFTRH